MSLIITRLQDDIGTITFNNAERRNVLSKALVDEMIQAIEALRNGKARVIVLRAPKGRGSGPPGTTWPSCRCRVGTPLPTMTRW